MLIKKALFVAAGITSLSLGLIGVFLPVLPTVPFILLAAFCFSKGSRRFYERLLMIPGAGDAIKEWETYGVIRPRAKKAASLGIASGALVIIVLPQIPLLIKAGVIAIMTWVMRFIWTKPSQVPAYLNSALPPNQCAGPGKTSAEGR